MKKITRNDYQRFVDKHSSVKIEDVEVPLIGEWSITRFAPPKKYKPETQTVWSFPDRGDWATHIGNYRGNWSPYIPRNLILRYTDPGDFVLDQMVGSGTTLVESKLLGRNGIGVDINKEALMVAHDRLNFSYNPLDPDYKKPNTDLFLGDARNLNLLNDECIDLIATHPPYAGIIRYTGERVPGDLSSLKLEPYVAEMKKVASEAYRVLKPGKHCAILIGDTRKYKHYVPISTRIMGAFLEASFILREDIIKLQHKMKSTRERWAGDRYDFYLIGHEHLYVFRKPDEGERTTKFKASMKWW